MGMNNLKSNINMDKKFNKELSEIELLRIKIEAIEKIVDVMSIECCRLAESIESNRPKSFVKKDLEKIIKSPATKGYFNGVELPELDPETGIDGITNLDANF
jgi:hypothetical protein